MHPILFARDRLLLYLLAWLPVAVILSAMVVRTSALTWEESLLLTSPLAIIYSFLCLASFYLCRALPLQTSGYLRLIGIFGVAALLLSGLWVLATRGWIAFLQQLSLLPGLEGGNEGIIQLFFLNGILLFLLTVFMHYLMITVDHSRVKEQQALQQSILAREAELRALKAQIHPHFLFNSLNSISALTSADPPAARAMSIRLAEFLRKVLNFGAFENVTLEQEIDLAKDYLAIEKTRFGERLDVETHLQDSALRCLVPPLILQPLVENAVRHGISPMPEGGAIVIRAEVNEGRLTIAVENPVDADYKPPAKPGMGLENVRKRLAAIYGAEGQLRTEKTPGKFTAAIYAPARMQ